MFPVTTTDNAIYMYHVSAKGIDVVQSPDNNEFCRPYFMGDHVWMKPPGSRCTTRFKCGRVTDVVSQQSVLADGILRHVRGSEPFSD